MDGGGLGRMGVWLDSKRAGGGRHTGFIITAASEIMAIVALAKDRKDLRKRLDSIVVGVTRGGTSRNGVMENCPSASPKRSTPSPTIRNVSALLPAGRSTSPKPRCPPEPASSS